MKDPASERTKELKDKLGQRNYSRGADNATVMSPSFFLSWFEGGVVRELDGSFAIKDQALMGAEKTINNGEAKGGLTLEHIEEMREVYQEEDRLIREGTSQQQAMHSLRVRKLKKLFAPTGVFASQSQLL